MRCATGNRNMRDLYEVSEARYACMHGLLERETVWRAVFLQRGCKLNADDGQWRMRDESAPLDETDNRQITLITVIEVRCHGAGA